MKVFHNPRDKAYRPLHSFFNGRFVPYPDVPERTEAILAVMQEDPRFQSVEMPAMQPATMPEGLAAIHDPGYLETLADVCGRLGAEEEFFSTVMAKAPQLLKTRYARIKAGYYAVDNTTPLLSRSFDTALGAVAVAHASAEAIRGGERLVYGLMRPPGHHAGREFYAGYCLLNNAALAADRLSAEGRVAVLDVDYHHGNGTQDIFYEREDVLYVSLHCRPEEDYPYIAGGAAETGSGAGLGFNRNFPLPGGTDWAAYRPALEAALESIAAFAPAILVVSAGFDTMRGDPIGNFNLQHDDFHAMGGLIRQAGLPTLVIQEGGYLVSALGEAVLRFFNGLEVS